MSHTPGPWVKNGYAIESSRQTQTIAEVTNAYCGAYRPWTPRGEANARLIASAPSLLKALEAIVARYAGEFDNPALIDFGPLSDQENLDMRDIAIAAIARANLSTNPN